MRGTGREAHRDEQTRAAEGDKDREGKRQKNETDKEDRDSRRIREATGDRETETMSREAWA